MSLPYGVSFVAHVMAYDSATGLLKTGDAANILLKWNKDGTSATVTSNSGVPTEVDASGEPGHYKITISATEAQCLSGKISGKSSTGTSIIIIGNSYAFDFGPDLTFLAPGPHPALGILDCGRAGTVADTGHLILRAAGGAAFATNALRGAALDIRAGTTGKGTRYSVITNTSANPTVIAFDADPDAPLTVGDTVVDYILWAQANQSTSVLPQADMKAVNGHTVTGDGTTTPFHT